MNTYSSFVGSNVVENSASQTSTSPYYGTSMPLNTSSEEPSPGHGDSTTAPLVVDTTMYTDFTSCKAPAPAGHGVLTRDMVVHSSEWFPADQASWTSQTEWPVTNHNRPIYNWSEPHIQTLSSFDPYFQNCSAPLPPYIPITYGGDELGKAKTDSLTAIEIRTQEGIARLEATINEYQQK